MSRHQPSTRKRPRNCPMPVCRSAADLNKRRCPAPDGDGKAAEEDEDDECCGDDGGGCPAASPRDRSHQGSRLTAASHPPPPLLLDSPAIGGSTAPRLMSEEGKASVGAAALRLRPASHPAAAGGGWLPPVAQLTLPATNDAMLVVASLLQSSSGASDRSEVAGPRSASSSEISTSRSPVRG